ncbi:hypothetical protein [Phenylobacterium sp.]|uniref:hypothetical protein n=1 Tax=Phenylobacterium sp. TaxID=1871053 RepID=UPI002635511E|nr:hypothetical protein [Phenylobacterium sp.]
MKMGRTKNALLAALSMSAATAALAPASASDFDAAAHPQIVAVEAPAVLTPDAAQADENKPVNARKWALIAIAAGALAGLVRLVGPRKLAKAVADTTVEGARITAKAASSAVRATGRALSSPLRFLALVFGLGLFALTGAGLYDVEWILGLLSGAALAGAAFYGALKTRRVLSPIKAARRRSGQSVNGN